MKEMNNLLLTFIIPVYNSERTLLECLNSIITQKEKNYEIILVDDGSEEGCANLCDEIARNVENTITVLHKTNGGSLSARLSGLKFAKGKYVIFVDSDDLIEPGCLTTITNNIMKNKADLYLYDFYNDMGGMKKKIRLSDHGLNDCINEKKNIFKIYMNGILNSVCPIVTRTKVLQTVAAEMKFGKISNGEDRLHKLFILLQSDSIRYISYAFYYCRTFDDSQGADSRKGFLNEKIYEDTMLVFSEVKIKYEKMGFSLDEGKRYDIQFVKRICRLLEKNVVNNYYNIRKVLDLMYRDRTFKELVDETRKALDIHSNIILWCVLNKHISILQLYFIFCKIFRRVKYEKK